MGEERKLWEASEGVCCGKRKARHGRHICLRNEGGTKEGGTDNHKREDERERERQREWRRISRSTGPPVGIVSTDGPTLGTADAEGTAVRGIRESKLS